MKDNRKALNAAIYAKDQALQTLRAEQQRGLDLQTAYDNAQQQLTMARSTSALLAQDTESASGELEQLKRATLGSKRAVEQATARLTAAQSAEMRLREKLEDAERQLSDMRSRAADLEAELEMSKLGAEKAARATKTALAAARTNETGATRQAQCD
ncbi:MAG: hypothetical protein HC869_02885 [Rhodospirillales bacterium]|nr:hypothetical protein [Rhodospirillales bacterium]